MTNHHDCSDCGVGMERTQRAAEGVGDHRVETTRDAGVLNRPGVGYQTPIRTVGCPSVPAVAGLPDESPVHRESRPYRAFLRPEHGLTRLYADRFQ
jgi:hypothetical protein